jgi:hypothetical protein
MIWVVVREGSFMASHDTPVEFAAGIDSLKYMDIGEKFYVEVEVVAKDEDSMVLEPRQIAAIEEER